MQRMTAEEIRFWGVDQGKAPEQIEAYLDQIAWATYRDAEVTDPVTDTRYFPTREGIAGDFDFHFIGSTGSVAPGSGTQSEATKLSDNNEQAGLKEYAEKFPGRMTPQQIAGEATARCWKGKAFGKRMAKAALEAIALCPEAYPLDSSELSAWYRRR